MTGMRGVLCAALVLAGPGLAGCGLDVQVGSGDRVPQARALHGQPFDRVTNGGALEVHVREGAEASVVVTLEEDLQRFVRVEVRDGVLEVDHTAALWTELPGRVDVTLPRLAGVRLDGSGAVEVSDVAPGRDVELTLDGSGPLRFQGAPRLALVHQEGSGALTLEGEAAELRVTSSGSGPVRARGFPAAVAHLGASGSGSVVATASREAHVRLTGSGSIELWGEAQVATLEDSGSGSLVLRR
jgi:hypothetical protein